MTIRQMWTNIFFVDEFLLAIQFHITSTHKRVSIPKSKNGIFVFVLIRKNHVKCDYFLYHIQTGRQTDNKKEEK